MSRLTLALSPSLRTAAVGLAALVAPAAAPAALRAQTAPTPPKVFYACYVPSSGTTYRIKEADLQQECSKSTHVQFSWTDGNPAALSKTFTISSGTVTVNPAEMVTAVAACPSGSQLVGGGHWIYRYSATEPPPVIRLSAPVDTANPSGPTNAWRVELQNLSLARALSFAAYARCAQ